MNILFPSFRGSAKVPAAVVSTARRPQLVRTFVETGDERCPIAGIWSRLDLDVAADDPEISWPAVRRLLPWRAFLSCVHRALPTAI